MQQINEADLDSYLEQWMYRRLQRRLFPFFRATITQVNLPPGALVGPPFLVNVQRNGESTPDGNTYVCNVPGYAPSVNDDVDMMWRDNDTAYVFAPVVANGLTAPGKAGWVHWSRYVVGPGGSLDTSSNPGGDIPVPPGYKHAWVIVSNAVDTSTNTVGTFGGMQLGINNGAIDTAADYIWTDSGSDQTTGGAAASLGPEGSVSGGDNAWRNFITTGGGTSAAWPSSANIWLYDYANTGTHKTAIWDILQINNGLIARRHGAGYYQGAAGPLTLLHFYYFPGAFKLAAGTTFDLLVMK